MLEAADPPKALSGRDRALRYLREKVLADPSVQGTFLNEQVIATAVGVSRTPVREALLILAADGLVRIEPKRGVYIPPMSAREVNELFDLRGLLERHAASQILAGGHRPEVALGEILAAQRELAARADDSLAAEFIAVDRRFHQAMVDSAGSALLSKTYGGLRDRQIRAGYAAVRSRHERWSEVCDEHARIVDALAAGDVAALHEAIDDHLRITLTLLLTL
ncbi:GntR family transcriptional regulator [Streptomyces odontomachi]|uniref:GntR family transcriptional regulator n=1 Tax=Streptomyces odontomachi TaxID=2944940 RepID=UPI00210CB1B6|nr:GntR family transcriptional regulator [Streptomyces sp. ODS25]